MSFARSLLTVSGLTVLSRVGGFVRDALTAAFLGAGPLADAYFVAQRLPNLFRSLFAEGAFSAAFVPLYAAEEEKNGRAAARAFASEALAVLLAVLIPFSALVIVFMPQVLMLLAPGFGDDPEKFATAVRYSRITFPYLLLISITALQSGVLNAHGRFAAASAAPIALNIVMIAALFMARYADFIVSEALSWAMVVAGFVQMIWLMISCARAGLTIKLVWPRLTERTVFFFKKIGPGALGAGAAQINLMLSTILASLLPTGAVSYLYYADRLNQMPLGIVGIAVATTLLPVLSRAAASNDDEKLRALTSRAIEFCLLLGLPAMLGLMILAQPIIRALFEYGAFTAADTTATAQALQAYALCIPAFLFVKVFSASFFARHDTATPVKFALVAVATNAALALALIGPLQHIGIALATSAATWTNALLLAIALRKRGTEIADPLLCKRFPRLILSATLLGLTSWLLLRILGPYLDTDAFVGKVGGLVGMIGLSGLVYALALHLSGAMRWRDFIATARRS